jgi:hypothetical protein
MMSNAIFEVEEIEVDSTDTSMDSIRCMFSVTDTETPTPGELSAGHCSGCSHVTN